MKRLLGRLQCWMTKRHVWGRAYQTVSIAAMPDNIEIWRKHCRRCGYGQAVKRRAKA